MKSDRMRRVNRLLRTTLAQLLPRVIKDPRVGSPELISVVEVRATPDLRHATVYVAGPQECELDVSALAHAAGFLRRELARRVNLKYVPELRFELDGVSVAAARIEEILEEIAGDEREAVMELSLDEVCDVFSQTQRVLVTSHPNPDGDAIGSMLACYWALKPLGKQVWLYNPDPIPTTFSFLSGVEEIHRHLPEQAFDHTIVLDCSDERMFPEGVPSRERLGKVVVVDHHKTLGAIGDVVYRDTSAAAVGVLLYRIFSAMKLELSIEAAEATYCSILSDTGSFRYQNTNPEALNVAAELVAAGVQPWHIASNLYETRPAGQLKLLARVLRTLQLSQDGTSAALTVDEQMLQETGCTVDMVDGFVNYARGLRGVQVAMLLRVERDGIRVSMRSRGAIDAAEIAAGFDGGGHHNAAGCTVRDVDVATLTERLFAEVSRQVALRQSSRPAQ